MATRQPFHDHVALHIEWAENGRARVRMKWRPEHGLVSGVLHGGFLAIVADAAVHTAADTLMGPGETLTTVELKTNFLAAVRGQDVIGEATIVKRGRTLVLGDVDIRSESGELVGKSLVTYMVLRARAPAPPAK